MAYVETASRIDKPKMTEAPVEDTGPAAERGTASVGPISPWLMPG